ncbi:hypothetical protein HU200_005579 [Digitaria exilis]|uniref:Uncharacterized protein n=1 Tax=Digitaria exilis TaxID=1010633 RepID=A0A835FRT2_9POAL|nr:hypothetical protein HU200_005579 [Digitaria exilis]CAB3470048.1 unnamed protein product [Digitaria exilis]
MLLLRRRLLPLFGAASPIPSPIHYGARPLLSNSASASPPPSPSTFSVGEHLAAASSLAPTRSRDTVKRGSKDSNTKSFKDLSLPRLNSASNPDAVLALLSSVGLSRADIDAVVAADPLLLRSSAEDIGPRLIQLRDRYGLSAPQIFRFLLCGSPALRRRDLGPSLEFFVSFFGSFEQLLMIMKKNNRILSVDLETVIKPNIATLRQYDIDVREIAHLCLRSVWILTFNPQRIKEFVLRAEELGVHRSSRMFKNAVGAVASIKKERVAPKLNFLKSTIGCSEKEVAILVSKMPGILGISEEKLACKIQFLLNVVGLEPRYIVDRPALLGYSLEKRLVPRHCVMKVLLAEGLLKCSRSFYSLAKLGEEAFKLRFVDCHKNSVPGLADVYAAACAGGVPS